MNSPEKSIRLTSNWTLWHYKLPNGVIFHGKRPILSFVPGWDHVPSIDYSISGSINTAQYSGVPLHNGSIEHVIAFSRAATASELWTPNSRRWAKGYPLSILEIIDRIITRPYCINWVWCSGVTLTHWTWPKWLTFWRRYVQNAFFPSKSFDLNFIELCFLKHKSNLFIWLDTRYAKQRLNHCWLGYFTPYGISRTQWK